MLLVLSYQNGYQCWALNIIYFDWLIVYYL